MGSYIYTICAAAILSAVICAAAPEKYSKFISFAAGLAVMLVIISPLKNITDINLNLELPADEEESVESNVHETAARALADSIAETFYGKFGEKENFKVKIILSEGEEFAVKEAIVYTDQTDADVITKYLSELYGFEIKVEEGKGA